MLLLRKELQIFWKPFHERIFFGQNGEEVQYEISLKKHFWNSMRKNLRTMKIKCCLKRMQALGEYLEIV